MQEPLPVLRSTAAREAGVVGSTLRRRAREGHSHELVRLGPNAFVPLRNWQEAGPRQRYVTRVHARLGSLHDRAVASHVSAVAMHELPWLTNWPDAVHITVPRASVRPSSETLAVHTRPLDPDEIDRSSLARVTGLVRTAVDIALSAHPREATVVLDAVLRRVARDLLVDALERRPTARSAPSALRLVEFADPRAGSVAESLARIVFRELGLPPPELQHDFEVDGHRYAVDFWFPDQGVVVEIDGRAKYEQARYMDGRTSVEVIVDEKRRHESLLTVPGVRHIVRLEWRDLWSRRTLIRRLEAAGLSCTDVDAISACGLLVAS